MSESKLRELRTRCKETGSLEDEVAWLLERLRAGDLDREKLELASYVGHEAAATAVKAGTLPAELTSPDEETSWIRRLWAWLTIRRAAKIHYYSDLEEWAKGLARWDKEVCVRAAVAAARLALTLRRDDLKLAPGDLLGKVRGTLAAAEAWLLDPSEEHRSAAGERAHETFRYDWTRIDSPSRLWACRMTACAVYCAVDACGRESHLEWIAARGIDFAARAIAEDPSQCAYGTFEVLAQDEGADVIRQPPPAACARVRAAIRDALVPWALAVLG